MPPLRAEPLTRHKGAVCERILCALPEWFGMEAAIADYVKDVEPLPCWVIRVDGLDVGFMSLAAHRDWSREIHVMGVLPAYHGRGVGRALVEAAAAAALADGVRWLLVKTLGPSHPDPHYARTREFYLAMGFEPLEELLDLWPGNPALLMARRLASVDTL